MSKIVCISGCLGFIGSEITDQCLKLGWVVYGVDSCVYGHNMSRLVEFSTKYPKTFNFLKEDINNLNELFDIEVFINAAASTHVDQSISNSQSFIHSNVNGVYHLLELFRKTSYSRKLPLFCHISTDEVYGSIENGEHTEENILCPRNPYSATKACGNQMIVAWSNTYTIPFLICRPTNNFGKYQSCPTKLIPRTIKHLNLGKKIELHNGGDPQRCWLNVSDCAAGIITIINSGKYNEIYNIPGNVELRNKDVVSKIVKVMFNDDNVEKYCDFSYNRKGQDLRYAISGGKIYKLGWKQEKDFDTELPSIVDYYKNNFVW